MKNNDVVDQENKEIVQNGCATFVWVTLISLTVVLMVSLFLGNDGRYFNVFYYLKYSDKNEMGKWDTVMKKRTLYYCTTKMKTIRGIDQEKFCLCVVDNMEKKYKPTDLYDSLSSVASLYNYTLNEKLAAMGVGCVSDALVSATTGYDDSLFNRPGALWKAYQRAVFYESCVDRFEANTWEPETEVFQNLNRRRFCNCLLEKLQFQYDFEALDTMKAEQRFQIGKSCYAISQDPPAAKPDKQ